MTLWTQLWLDDIDRMADVTVEYERGYPATRYEPAQADEIIVTDVKIDGQDAPEWSYDIANRIARDNPEMLMDASMDQYEMAACDAAKAKRERMAAE